MCYTVTNNTGHLETCKKLTDIFKINHQYDACMKEDLEIISNKQVNLRWYRLIYCTGDLGRLELITHTSNKLAQIH